MSLIELLAALGLSGTGLRALLVKAGEASPDLKDQADAWIALLDGGLSPENLVSLASQLPGEIANIAKGQIEPKDHPSDAI